MLRIDLLARLAPVTFATLIGFSFTALASEKGGGGGGEAKKEEHKEEPVAEKEEGFVEFPARTSGRDIKIPRALVKTIEDDYRKFLTANAVSTKENLKRKLLNLSVELWQKSPVALTDNTRILTPLGGGVVDLNEVVTPLRGAFFMKILARKEDGHELPDLRVYYVSQAKSRTIAGEKYGAGCGKYMDITKFFTKKTSGSKRGFELYTADQRYLSVVGGTFVVFGFEKENLSVGTLTFQDSRFPDLLCE